MPCCRNSKSDILYRLRGASVMRSHAILVLALALLVRFPVSAQNSAHPQELPMHHAHGTFDVITKPSSLPAPAEGLGRFSLEKQLHGDLEGTGQGEMLTAGDPKAGAAGYVAIERLTGSLSGMKGSISP